MATDPTDPRRFAEDVMLVYEHIREPFLPETVSTPARQELHEWAQSNKKEFFKTFVLKAGDIMAKFTKPDDDIEILRAERRSIADMKILLQQYLTEAENAPLV